MPTPGMSGRSGAVCVDLFKTLIEMRRPDDEDWDWATKYVYSEVYDVPMSDPRIQQLPTWLAKIRRDHDERAATKQILPFWLRNNIEVGKILTPGLSEKQAETKALEAHRLYTGDPSLYELRPDMEQAMEELMTLRDRYTIILTTNSSSSRMVRMVEHFDLRAYFDKMYSAGWLGVRKPLPQFWMAVRGAVMLPIVSLMGNSMKTDAPISNVGTVAHLLDRSGRTEKQLKASTNGEFPRWAHISHERRLLRFHTDPLVLVKSIIGQMDEEYTKKRISLDPDA